MGRLAHAQGPEEFVRPIHLAATTRDDLSMFMDLLHLTELEFTSLLKTIEVEPTGKVTKANEVIYALVDEPSMLDALIYKLRASGSFSIATETVPDRPDAESASRRHAGASCARRDRTTPKA